MRGQVACGLRSYRFVMACLGLLVACAPALAGGGHVMPSQAKPDGYSLTDAAAATAVYNTGPRNTAPPALPFFTLVNDATVNPGTRLYVPVYFADDSAIPVPPFPTNVNDQKADAAYLMGLIGSQYGVTAFIIVVDGQVTVLDDSYIRGTTTAPLQDGPPAGTHYIVSGAFLTPLTPGKHTIGIGGVIGGQPVTFVSYNVTVGH